MNEALLTHRTLRKKPFLLRLTQQEGFYSLRLTKSSQNGIWSRVLFISSSIVLGVILAAISLQLKAEEDVSAVSIQQNSITYNIKLDGSYQEEHTFVKRIEKTDGIASAGEVNLSYTPKLESIKILAAYTLLPTGERIQVPAKSIHRAKGVVGGTGYRDTNNTVIIFPNVVVGSQLYVNYIKTCHTPLFPGQFTLRRVILPYIKMANFEININFDRRLKLQIDSKDVEGGALPDKDGRHRYHFTYKQDKVIPFDKYQIDSGDYAPYVQASTFANYEALGAAYQEKMKDKVKVTAEIQALAKQLTLGVEQPKEQVRILYNWVSKNIRYVSAYIGNGGYVPHDSQTILSNRWGDCKDHVVILESLLAAKGIASSGALINTGPSFQLPKLPGMHPFNHLITYVPSLDLYLDSTAQFAPMGTLPSTDLNKEVVLTGLAKVGKTPPMLARENTSRSTIIMKVLSDGTIEGTSTMSNTGTKDIDLRNLKFISQSLTQEEISDILLNIANLTGKGKVHTTDPNDLNKPLEVGSSFTLDPIANIPGPGSMAIPAGLVDEAINRNTLEKPKDKINPHLLCHSNSTSNHYVIEFPDNIKITHVPENVNYSDPAVQYTASYVLKGKVLEINRELIIQNKSMVCGEAENELDKKFFPIFQRDMRAQVMYE